MVCFLSTHAHARSQGLQGIAPGTKFWFHDFIAMPFDMEVTSQSETSIPWPDIMKTYDENLAHNMWKEKITEKMLVVFRPLLREFNVNLFLAISSQLTDNLQTISRQLRDNNRQLTQTMNRQLAKMNRQLTQTMSSKRKFFALEDLVGNKVRANSLGPSGSCHRVVTELSQSCHRVCCKICRKVVAKCVATFTQVYVTLFPKPLGGRKPLLRLLPRTVRLREWTCRVFPFSEVP